MAARQLPERPNLDHLKRQAKDLLHAARTQDAGALARFRTLPAFTHRSDADLARAPLALHDAQSVIAREYGFDSWNALGERVDELTLEFAAAADAFIEAATDGRTDRAERLLALHPGVTRAHFHAALVAGDAETVERRLVEDPRRAVERGGPRGWEPLHYVCYTSMGARPESREAGLVAIARQLLARGANPNLRFPWRHHEVERPVLWGATFVVRSLPLARVLLDAGANPSDGVTLPLAAGGGDIDVLELLLSYGADVNRPWATDGAAPLYAILQWTKTADGVRWLLAHGADPDPVCAANGETPLHMVASSWDVSLAEELVNRGADLNRRRADGRTPYAVAELNGNRDVAAWLLAHGAAQEVPAVDQLVAACSRGDRPAVDAILSQRPEARHEIAPEHYAAFYRAAERNDLAALEAMIACGFDPNRGDESIGKTAVHVAAMEGWPEAVGVLLAHGGSVAARDREFNATPLIWAAEGSRGARADRNHAAVGRLLLDAGSPVEWQQPGAEPAAAIVEIVNAWRGGRN
jgi:ankyrin repeat protein